MHRHHPRPRPHLRAIIAGLSALLVLGSATAGAASPAPSAGAPDASPSAAPASPGASPGASPIAELAVVAVPSSGSIAETGGTWQVDLPTLFGPLDPAILAAVNETLAAGSAADLAAFQAGSTPPPTGFDGTDGFTSTFSVAALTPEVLSLRSEISTYAAGAAHPLSAMEGWTFDLRTGRRVELADLFQADAAYLPILSRVARHQLRTQLGTDEATRTDIRRGTRPRARLFTGWAITPAGLEITFGQYQVGPYAIGMPVVVVPWARLAALLDPTGPAAAFAPPAPASSGIPSPAASPPA